MAPVLKKTACQCRSHMGLLPGSGKCLRGGQGNLLQYSCLENPIGQRSLAGHSLWCHSIRHNWSDLVRTHDLKLEKAVATHSCALAWKIPWTEEPGRLQSMGSQRVRHDWATSLSLFTFMHWRRKWQPTPVFLPGESQGRQSLVGCRLWGRTESDTTEVT